MGASGQSTCRDILPLHVGLTGDPEPPATGLPQRRATAAVAVAKRHGTAAALHSSEEHRRLRQPPTFKTAKRAVSGSAVSGMF